MRIDIYLAVSLLFAIMTALSEKPLWRRRALYPMLLLLVVSELNFGYSRFALIKSAFILFTLLCPLTSSEEHVGSRMFTFVHMLSLITMITLLQRRILPADTISLALIASVAIMTLYDLIVLKGKQKITSLQMNAIALCGAVVAGFSPDYYSQFFGILILCIYQIVKVYFVSKSNVAKKEQFNKRLDKLENQFSRQVENATKRITKGMEEKVETIEEKSMKDPLTNSLNRSMINKKINELITEKHVRIFSIALIDLDDFKHINDDYGHIAGDNALKFLATHFQTKKRRHDLFGRFGGDEFIMIMPNIDAEDAVKIVDYNRKEIDAESNPHFTITSGVSTFPFDGESIEELIEAADYSLYKAKDAGKNIVLYKPKSNSPA